MSPPLSNKKDVRDFTRAQMVNDYRFRYPQKFVPKPAFDLITSLEVIRQIIEQDVQVVVSNQEQEEFINRVHRYGRKIFAICVFRAKSMDYVKVMLDNGLTDEKLPLRGDNDFGSLAQKDDFVDSFIEAQKHFNTVYLEENRLQALVEEDWDKFSIPIHFEETKTNLKGEGAFGKVYQVRIHPDQRSFQCETNDDDLFAMKITESTQSENRESNYHRSMIGQEHPNLVKCLTSFTLGSQYYMVYDLANGDLERFIEKSHPSNNRALSSQWLAQQLAGLAGALQVVHNPEGSHNSSSGLSLGVPSTHQSKTGYIHDIKPENILVFKKRGGPYLLRLSDFSCAKVVEIVSTISGKRASWKTGSKKGTPIYQAPETKTEFTSRPYDMWSLGCVYLEILVWYTDGYPALKEFRRSREGYLEPDGLEDHGFYHETADGIVKLRDAVEDMIDRLSGRCEGDLKDIVETIPSLLRIDPKARLSASELVNKLRHLGTGTGTHSVSTMGSSFPTTLPVRTLNPSPLYRQETDSDSDSDFGGMVKVTHPSDG